MTETGVVRILNRIRGFGGKYKILVDNQNGVHPMNEPFVLVGKIDEYNLGTSTHTLTTRDTYDVDVEVDGKVIKSKDGVFVMNQPKAYVLRIAMQGTKTPTLAGENVEDYIEYLKLMMDTPRVRQEFFDIGYSYDIDPQTLPIPVQLNTDQYVRHSFKVTFKTNISIEFDQTVMGGAEINGVFKDVGNQDIHEYTETVLDVPK